MPKKTMTFEAAMARLEEILNALEGGTETLDASLKLYEEGISLIRASSELLENAELSVKQLRLEADGNVGLADFHKTEAEQ